MATLPAVNAMGPSGTRENYWFPNGNGKGTYTIARHNKYGRMLAFGPGGDHLEVGLLLSANVSFTNSSKYIVTAGTPWFEYSPGMTLFNMRVRRLQPRGFSLPEIMMQLYYGLDSNKSNPPPNNSFTSNKNFQPADATKQKTFSPELMPLKVVYMYNEVTWPVQGSGSTVEQASWVGSKAIVSEYSADFVTQPNEPVEETFSLVFPQWQSLGTAGDFTTWLQDNDFYKWKKP